MRFGVFACALGLAAPAVAGPKLEASGFVGLDYFGDNIELGNSWAPEQIPGTAPVLGARLTYLVGARGELDFALEGELALATSFTGGSFDGGRMSYFAPVFGWRTHAMLRFEGLPYVRPHLVAGVGGQTVASSSPFMAKETDPELYWGPGASMSISERWQLRLDVRHGVMPAREGSATSTLEVQLGIATTFGLPERKPHRVEVTDIVPAPPVPEDKDTDRDGIPDRLDACPAEAEAVNGITDDDGCPEPDPDGDGMVGEVDRCPDQAEDFDHYQDEDGCPEPDNDLDGIADSRDSCPIEPETRNGYDDEDGCPDAVPPEVIAALDVGRLLKFDAKRAKITEGSKKALDGVAALLREHTLLKVEIIGHPDKAGGEDLAKRRADAVKWYLVDQGIAADQVSTSMSMTAAKVPMVEIVLASPAP